LEPLLTSWREARQWTLDRDGRMCVLCRSTDGLTVHHKIPRHLTRDSSPRNLVALCRRCHDLIELLDQLSTCLDWINIYLRRLSAVQKGH
jgi:hypothetical protein